MTRFYPFTVGKTCRGADGGQREKEWRRASDRRRRGGRPVESIRARGISEDGSDKGT